MVGRSRYDQVVSLALSGNTRFQVSRRLCPGWVGMGEGSGNGREIGGSIVKSCIRLFKSYGLH